MAVLGLNNQGMLHQVFLTNSQTWTAEKSGIIRVVCIGSGGGGGVACNDGKGTGGGAGGYSEQTISVASGSTYTVTVGVAPIFKNVSNTSDSSGKINGGNGGASRFVTASGTTIDLNAGGGSGGIGNRAVSHLTALAGGVGGTASGGTINRVGGAGGSIAQRGQNDADAQIATGGGAVAIRSTVGFAGGSITGNLTLTAATGGGGIGGAGGAITVNARASNGGGSGGPGVTDASNVQSYNGFRFNNGGIATSFITGLLEGSAAGYQHSSSSHGYVSRGTNIDQYPNQNIGTQANGGNIFDCYGMGGAASYGVAGESSGLLNGFAGGGGGGTAVTGDGNTDNKLTRNPGGIFSGGGGKVSMQAMTSDMQCGHGGAFGGGGGAGTTIANAKAFAGMGGAGVIIIHWLAYG